MASMRVMMMRYSIALCHAARRAICDSIRRASCANPFISWTCREEGVGRGGKDGGKVVS